MKSIVLFLIVAVFLSSCSQTVTEETVEKDLVAFTLDMIIRQKIEETANYIQTSGQPWVDAPPDANIIIWSPPVEYPSDIDYVKNDEPIKVWLYAEGKLVEVADKKETIQNYRTTHMSDDESDIWAWGYYEFGIMSISSNDQEATIYVGVSCGLLCGHGVMYTVERNSSGKWEIKETEDLWIS